MHSFIIRWRAVCESRLDFSISESNLKKFVPMLEQNASHWLHLWLMLHESCIGIELAYAYIIKQPCSVGTARGRDLNFSRGEGGPIDPMLKIFAGKGGGVPHPAEKNFAGRGV